MKKKQLVYDIEKLKECVRVLIEEQRRLESHIDSLKPELISEVKDKITEIESNKILRMEKESNRLLDNRRKTAETLSTREMIYMPLPIIYLALIVVCIIFVLSRI